MAAAAAGAAAPVPAAPGDPPAEGADNGTDDDSSSYHESPPRAICTHADCAVPGQLHSTLTWGPATVPGLELESGGVRTAALRRHSIVQCGGAVFAVGGGLPDQARAWCLQHPGPADQWQLSPAPGPGVDVCSQSLVQWRGWIISYGGTRGGGVLPVVGQLAAFDAAAWLRRGPGAAPDAAAEWRELVVSGEAPCPRANHAAAVVGDSMLVYGGWNAGERFDDVWRLDLIESRWERVAVRPPPGAPGGPVERSNHSACPLGAGDVIFFGGVVGGEHSGLLTCLSSCGAWSRLRPAGVGLAPSSNAAVVALDDSQCLIFGGWDEKKQWNNQSVIYDHAARAVRCLMLGGIPPTPTWRAHGVWVPLHGVVVAVPGSPYVPFVGTVRPSGPPSLKFAVARHIITAGFEYPGRQTSWSTRPGLKLQ